MDAKKLGKKKRTNQRFYATMQREGLPVCTKLDRLLSIPMFLLSLAFLFTLGSLFHLTDGDLFSPLAQKQLILLGVLYVGINAEVLLHWHAGAKGLKRHLWYLVFPAFRLCPRDHLTGQNLWIPGLSWQQTNKDLEQYLLRVFSAPMIVIALLVLPVVGIEFFYADEIAASVWGWYVINACSGFIWVAFVFEFVVMLSSVEKRFKYCRQNWIDVAVILLPLVSFMGAARLGRLLKLKQLTRTAKIYRIRGLALRAWRAVVALEVIDTLLRRDPETRMEALKNKIKEREMEIQELTKRLNRLESKTRKNKFELKAPQMLSNDQHENENSMFMARIDEIEFCANEAALSATK